MEVYNLIYRRFLASQMAAAVYDEVHVTVVGGEAVFTAKGSRLVFDGFLRVYDFTEEKENKPENTGEEAEEDSETTHKQLPALTVGEAIQALKITPQQHFTKPPTAYSEALLVKALEQDGVGRPSTYAQTVATLKKRGYVSIQRRRLMPTALGQEVHQVLSSKLPGLFEVPFTAQMEAALDEIAAGQREGKTYLKAFWSQVSPLFGETVLEAVVTSHASSKSGQSSTSRKQRSPSKKTTIAAPVNAELGICPQCGKPLVQRSGKHGGFIGCSGFPKCRFTKNLG